ncbi:hypothetical protein ACFVUS_13520 [Nocardia sp. NPDC058058]|uniref:hypothetical protein n=1 Tax=Nocardia sp. NPDC058058 TaxID=3346317 RepID=UPI0036D887B1
MRAFPSHPGTPDLDTQPTAGASRTTVAGISTPDNDHRAGRFATDHTVEPIAATADHTQRRDDAAADLPGSGTYARRADAPGASPLHRVGMLAGAATVLFSVAVAFAPSAGAAATAPVIAENAAARVGIMESTAAQPDPSAIADGFVAEFGYRPIIEDGMLVNPGGDCSSPIPLPREFDTACKAHDLGYDMLRYAGNHGQPLGPWARQTADAALDQRMHESCLARADGLSRARCQLMAGVAATFVDLNSARQDYGVPVHEAMFDSTDNAPAPIVRYSAFGLLAAVFAATATFFARRSRRPSPARAADARAPRVATSPAVAL